jgi:precorrin-3B synthase
MTVEPTILLGTPPSGIAAASARRGACPTLRTPMQTGDGLLARIRVGGARLGPHQLAELARLAAEHGNGLVEITARGNLQVRGLTATSAAPFAEAVTALFSIEAGLVVDISPLAGNDPCELADPRPLAKAIRDGAATWAERLGPKVSVVIDSSGQVPLGALKADIRLVALPDQLWAITLGGGKPQQVDADGAVATALALLGALAAMGPDARATDLFPASGEPASLPVLDGATGRLRLLHGHSTPIALPFGSARSTDLVALCEAAMAAGIETLRLAPGHTLLLDNAPETLTEVAATLGFITRPDDPRRRTSACIGNQGCASGHIPARQIASSLAAHLLPDRHLHVSGCPKGCAHPRRAEVTLVGRPDGIGLVIHGRAGDTPELILDEAELADALVLHQGGR